MTNGNNIDIWREISQISASVGSIKAIAEINKENNVLMRKDIQKIFQELWLIKGKAIGYAMGIAVAGGVVNVFI